MWLGILLLIAVIVAVHGWEYNCDVKEYSFAQPATLDRHSELSALLQEKIPIAVEIGALPWRPVIAEKAVWQIETESGSVSSSEYKGEGPILNQEELATEMQLTTGLEDLNAGRPWWWLPSIHNCRVDVLSTTVKPLSWVTAEREWIGCTHGGPVTVWLVHSAYRKYLDTNATIPLDPWTATVAEVPWWGRVKFVEVTVKPGWCLGIPAHWGFAVRVDGTISANANEPAWIWMGSQHSFASQAISNIFKSREE